MPNYTAAVKMLINGSPTSPFSMQLPPLMAEPNPELGKALEKLSASKYGRPRAEVEAEIQRRWATVKPTPTRKPANPVVTAKPTSAGGGQLGGGASSNSFIDNWLAKRQNLASGGQAPSANGKPADNKAMPAPSLGNVSQQPSQMPASQPAVVTSNQLEQLPPLPPLDQLGDIGLPPQQQSTIAQPVNPQPAQPVVAPVNNGTEWSRQTVNQGAQAMYPQSPIPPAQPVQQPQTQQNPDEFTINLH